MRNLDKYKGVIPAFILGAFTKAANAGGIFIAFLAATAVLVFVNQAGMLGHGIILG